MSGVAVSSVKAGEVNAEVAARAYRRIKDYVASHPADDEDVIIVEHGDEALVIPRPALVMFTHILAQLAEGRGVSVVPSQAELTTQQAADMLKVSRPYLIGLLESGQIPFRKVGRHRRVTVEAVLHYQRADDARRRMAADEVSALTEELGLY